MSYDVRTWPTEDLRYSGPDVGVARHAEGGGYLYKWGELLVASDDLVEVQRLLHEWREPSPPGGQFDPQPLAEQSQWVRLTLGERSTPIPRLVADLRADDRLGQPKGPLRVSANHVLRGNSHGTLGATGSVPARASDAIGPPPPGFGSNVERSVRVAVLDTDEAFKHEWFNGRVERLASPEEIPDRTRELRKPLPRYAGHGTFVAGIVLQHAPRATIVARPVLDEWGEVSDTDLAKAIRQLSAEKVRIVQLSCAGRTGYNTGLPATEEALAEMWKGDPQIQVVAPAGNGASDVPWFPAALKGVIAVGALGLNETRADFSNYGGWVDACAPGVDVKSTFLSNFRGEVEAYRMPAPGKSDWSSSEFRDFDGWAYWSGTSFAAARVTGGLADLMDRDEVGGAQAAFQLYGGGRRRFDDDGFDLGVPVLPRSYSF
jgi:hypothetical protein